MALLSAFNIIRIISILHITIAYYFLVDPRLIAEQNFVFLIGNSMDMPHITDFNKAGPVTALLGLLFGFFGLSDLIAVSINEPVAVEYWSAATPLRLVCLFPLTAYTFLYKPTHFSGVKSKLHVATPGDNLKNSFTFSWCFLETMMWFWVYVSLREQRRAAAQRVLEGKAAAR